MLFSIRAFTLLVLLTLTYFSQAQAPTAEELVGIHVLTQTEIDAISNPIIGTLVYNSDNNSPQVFGGSNGVSTIKDGSFLLIRKVD
ncbi:MAG: hypothetical protein AB8B59_04365 [Maribacter sp.]